MTPRSWVTGVVLTNYKSFVRADVELCPLTFLVGPNGAGKSNFIDALRFCRDALRTPLDQVFAKRNTNLYHLLHRSPAGANALELRFDFTLEGGQTGYYKFAIGPQQPRGFVVLHEKCVVDDAKGQPQSFEVSSGNFTSMIPVLVPPANPNRLFLVNASALPAFQPVYALLSGMEFYAPDPERMRLDLDTTGSSETLDEDGENIASVLDRLAHTQKPTKDRISEYLRAIVPGLERVESEEFKAYKLLNFSQAVHGVAGTVDFLASNMSDGTLRALALLVALFQNAGSDSPASLIGIEEPETGLHPAATAVLWDALREASESVQVVVTSHSPDLLDNPEIPAEMIRAVAWENGETKILPIDTASRSALHDRLFTAGELMRMGQLKTQSEMPGDTVQSST